ncbi:GNAT family N-acetyltransferase [Sphingomicrobium flavum]|uniref:GNAT family N-acetyltransferase n=1 Tax=Sphingomicrobium flavum TaxID=1229164 RepID=UPI0021ADC72E|nr:GNAT family N-acetyltransferase [Sphingomicrobium flavum]
MQSGWQLFEGELDAADVAGLLALHFREMRAGSPPSACHVLERNHLRADDIRFFSLREAGGRLLGVGALKRRGHGEGEIKSMRTAPDALCRGVGRALLEGLVGAARGEGLRIVRLETGNSEQFAPANRLYRNYGFTPCGPFADYKPTDFTLFYELEL